MFTSQSLTRFGALNMHAGGQECACECVHGGHRVHGWLVSVIVSEQEHTWDASSGGPESLSCFRAPLSGSSPALATVRTFMMYLCIVHDRKGDGLPPHPPPPHQSVSSQRRHKNSRCLSDRARCAHVRLRTWQHTQARACAHARACTCGSGGNVLL